MSLVWEGLGLDIWDRRGMIVETFTMGPLAEPTRTIWDGELGPEFGINDCSALPMLRK